MKRRNLIKSIASSIIALPFLSSLKGVETIEIEDETVVSVIKHDGKTFALGFRITPEILNDDSYKMLGALQRSTKSKLMDILNAQAS